MAKVKTVSRNNSPCFMGNDLSFADLVGLDISAESSHPKFDFDISSILQSDNEISLEKQCFDNEANEILHLLSEDAAVQSNSRNSGKSDMSLGGAVAKHNQENDRTLSELCFDGDISLTDVLYTYDEPTCLKAEKGSNGDLNFLNLLSSEDCSENVSQLVNSCHVLSFQPTHSVSLDSLAASHISNNKSNGSKNNFDEDFSFVFNFKNDDSNVFDFDNSSEKSQENSHNSTKNDLLCFLNTKHCCETSENYHQLNAEASDAELVPDIDLRFCIKNKKNSADKLSPLPESVDSGFDEADLIKSTSDNFEKSLLNTDGCLFGKEKLTHFKRSLFSRAISAKPKVDKTRLTKLTKIRVGLFQNLPASVISCNEEERNVISKKIVDNSKECVITSQFLTISDQKF